MPPSTCIGSPSATAAAIRLPVGLLDAVDVARLLLERGADPNAPLKKPILQRQHTFGDGTLGAGATPLMRAAKSGDIELVRVLLAAGADPKLTLPNGTTALMLAAGLGWRNGSPLAPSYDQGSDAEAVETLELLLSLGLDLAGSERGRRHGAACGNRGPRLGSDRSVLARARRRPVGAERPTADAAIDRRSAQHRSDRRARARRSTVSGVQIYFLEGK